MQINVTANWGSTGKIAEGIGQAVISKGWRSIIAYGRGKPISSSELIRIGNDWDMYLHALSARLFDNQGLMSKRATKKLIKQIKAIHPDIIHLHNIHGYFLNYRILFDYLARSGIPVVWTLHDCWSFTGHCTHFVTVNCHKWRTQCENCILKKDYPRSLFLDRSKNNYHNKKKSFSSIRNLTFVPVSHWINNYLKHSFLKGYSSYVIHNGIDTGLFHPTRYSGQNKFTVIGVANIWTKSKGFNDFIDLSKRFDPDIQIILVGVTVRQKKMLPDNIIAIERTVNARELAELYSSSDVYVNLTYADTFPTTNIEALACGTPVITYRTGGSPEAISEETGFIVEQGDLDGVLAAIKIIRKKGKNFYKDKCRERAVRYFRKEDRYNDYINLYESILKDNNETI